MQNYTVFTQNVIRIKSIQCECKLESASLRFLIFPCSHRICNRFELNCRIPHCIRFCFMMKGKCRYFRSRKSLVTLITWLHKAHRFLKSTYGCGLRESDSKQNGNRFCWEHNRIESLQCDSNRIMVAVWKQYYTCIYF